MSRDIELKLTRHDIIEKLRIYYYLNISNIFDVTLQRPLIFYSLHFTIIQSIVYRMKLVPKAQNYRNE